VVIVGAGFAGLFGIHRFRELEESWRAQVQEVADQTLYPRANSWYMGANIATKRRMFLPYIGGLILYREKCAEAARDGYKAFDLRRADKPARTYA
jgi:cyclohexanone monooxygenase